MASLLLRGARSWAPLVVPHSARSLGMSCTALMRTVKGKTPSSSRWLTRQKKDPLVEQAVLDQYRSRSAYKIIELDDRFHFLKPGSIVVDCGARPGSWSQVAARRIGTDSLSQAELATWTHGMVLAIDIKAMAEMPGVVVMDRSDLTCPQVQARVRDFLAGRKVDVILSDMAPNASGVHHMDHLRIMELCESVYHLAQDILTDSGVLVCKLWQGALTNSFKSTLKERFQTVKECRLKATRKESSEIYIYADGYNCSS